MPTKYYEVIQIHKSDIMEYPVLIELFRFCQHQYAVALDCELIRVPTNLTMSDIWEELTAENKLGLCIVLNRLGKKKNIHAGMLALMSVYNVLKPFKAMNIGA